ncbi:hypothetical protein [Legionella sp. CNM-4043-24]|uniref:hypothetical protein n=1 Tax=Legionella sp. CNM-4043-24 TaxID=3421646 RepID=UPI00403AE435
MLDELAEHIKQGNIDIIQMDDRLKYIDILSLYANHMNVQDGVYEPRLPDELQIEKQLLWLNAAYELAKSVVPDLDAIIAGGQTDRMLLLPLETLSSLSLMLNYLANTQWECTDDAPSLLLSRQIMAVSIAMHLEKQAVRDRHYSPKRALKYELELVSILFELWKNDPDYSVNASTMLEERMSAYINNRERVTIYSSALLTIASVKHRRQYNITNSIDDLEAAIFKAKMAIDNLYNEFESKDIYFDAQTAIIKAKLDKVNYLLKDHSPMQAAILAKEILSEHNAYASEKQQDFAKSVADPTVFFDKQIASMYEEQSNDKPEAARMIAQQLLSMYEENHFCGIKQEHLDQANAFLADEPVTGLSI